MKQPFIFAIFAATLAGAAPAQAQHIAADLLPPYEVSTIVASMGMRPLDRPIWRNGRYVINAIDRNGREVRVVLDAHDGQVIAVRPRMRDYVYEPRYGAPPPPPEYPRGAPYEPRYDQRYGAPPPPAAIPGRPPADDDDEYFDDDRLQGSLMPPAAPRGASPAPREATTGSVPRRVTSVGPTDRKADPAKPANSKAAVNKDNKGAAPVPRPRPAVANAKPDEPRIERPKTIGSTDAAADKPQTSDHNTTDKNAAKPDSAKPDAKEASNAKAANPDAAKPEVTKTEEPKTDIRVIDMSKPKTEEKPEDKPGEAIRY
ncbi:PepSY domain-containing protein [Pseudorhodoplanes sinuspersici]|uniref:Uncharacterized protein n=1 Tax=Pseudorhodoplanes sinuspersici TaxID=1235591 RepID=A0A1W6ZT05_9HYPH|nr:PepSY domain-containing protein [Pseudorhodoplanes sinuspersici]ARQ00490.1 hypothetical protein CAK95_16445 [Pseudorhodoplanes sinuspersici]RKE67330.1 YpeB-like protein with putative protease inhibitory function [Pseudorhodoplanes sinuspersici]